MNRVVSWKFPLYNRDTTSAYVEKAIYRRIHDLLSWLIMVICLTNGKITSLYTPNMLISYSTLNSYKYVKSLYLFMYTIDTSDKIAHF